MNQRSFIFVLKRYANLVFDTTCILLNLSKALYSLSAKKLSIQDLFLGALIQGLISLAQD
jgi:hypothetical protein